MIERDPHNLEREALTDHPIGEGLGWVNGKIGCTVVTYEVLLI